MSKNTTNETDTEVTFSQIAPLGYATITSIRTFHTRLSGNTPGPWKELMLHYKKDSYYFQGDINMRHLVNDAQQDGTLGFVAVTPISTYVGLSRNIPRAHSKFTDIDATYVSMTGGSAFLIFALPKEHTPEAMKFVKELVSQHRVEMRKLAQEIREVNNFFNHNIKHQDDIDNWGTKDNWATPFETMIQGAGDCEDYATAKYKTLRLLNIPDKSLKLHYVKAKQGRSSITIPHMILTYQDKNQDEIVLDNLVTIITPLKERIDIIPIFAFNNSHIWANNTKYGQDPQERIYHWKAFMERYEKQAFTCLVE
jgi:predicted transglutaminase-like cysteine proteinase